MSWDPPTFTSNYGQTEILHNVVVFIMIFIWVHVDERSYMFLGFTISISHEFLGCTMNLVLFTYFRMLLDISFSISGLGTCAIERKMDLSLQAHALGDFLILNSICSLMCLILNEPSFEFAFCFSFCFLPTVLFTV